MKKSLLTQILLLIGLLFVFQVLPAQQGGNPFHVKQKTSTAKILKTPTFLDAHGILGTQTQRSFQNVSGINYHTNLFQKPSQNAKVRFTDPKYDNDGLLILIENQDGYGVAFNDRSEEAVVEACYDYLNRIKTAMRVEEPEKEFLVEKQWQDDLGYTHVKLQQYYQGLEVFGGEVMLHGYNGFINRFNGTYYPTPEVEDLTPEIMQQDAVGIVIRDVSSLTKYKRISDEEQAFYHYNGPEVTLVIYHFNRNINSERLAWHISIRPNVLDWYDYFIDAKTGEILNEYNNTCTDGPATSQAVDLNGVTQTIHTYLANGKYYLIDASRSMFNSGQSQIPDNAVGAIVTLDANYSTTQNLTAYYLATPNNSWNNPTAVSAHTNAGLTYEYYKNTHGRNSIDGEGGTIYSIININDDNGNGMDNAFWNGQAMFYGNGNQLFLPLAGALDVGGHEMTHGVVQHTANLIYQYESGAINEAMADIGGTMVDRDNWKLGEDIIPAGSQYYPTGALRDMSNPHNGGTSLNDPCYQPANVNEMYHGSSDNGGVHINSGIINHAYYLIATAITKNKAEKLYYRALATYMTKSSQFIDCRLAFESAAKDLYGNNSNEYNAVVDAFYSVGIGGQSGGGSGSGGPGGIEVNPGDDFILSVDVNPNDQNTLYISNTDGSGFIAVSQTSLNRKPSIMDNGSVAVFVDEDHVMRAIELSGNYEEWQLSPDEIWDNVAVSKDGTKIAAITTEVDSAIWVYDFNSSQWSKYHLYNPTFSEDVITENVMYADAIEWDYTGQYLIYDAYNELANDDGDDISYWDMGFIRVWNTASNNWGDGKIFKLFSALPEGISIGNPSLSKNSPFIIAFDYYDETNDDLYVMASNLETGDVTTVFENTVLGFPNYSKLDNKIVFSAESSNNEKVIGQIAMQSDKITPSGDPSILIGYAKWPVWYATGERNLTGVEEQTPQKIFVNAYPNPFKDEVTVVAGIRQGKTYTISVVDVYGQLVSEQKETAGSELSTTKLKTSLWANGTYIVRVNTDRQTITTKIVKAK